MSLLCELLSPGPDLMNDPNPVLKHSLQGGDSEVSPGFGNVNSHASALVLNSLTKTFAPQRLFLIDKTASLSAHSRVKNTSCPEDHWECKLITQNMHTWIVILC